MAMFDPNQPMDFAAQNASLEEQRELAKQLRKRADTKRMGQGQMVGKIYVKPHWMEGVADLFNQYQAGQASRDVGAKEKELASAAGQARQQWASSLPQAMAAQPEQQGPVDPSNPQELAAKPAMPLTNQRIMGAAMQGMQIPGNEKASQMYATGALADLAREDTQAEKRETLAATMAAQRQKDVENLEYKREQLKEQARQHDLQLKAAGLTNDTRREIEGSRAASRAASDQIALQIAGLKKGQDQSKEAKIIDDDTEKLSKRAEPLIQVVSPATQVQNILDKAYDPKTKKYKDIPGFQLSDRLKPLGMMDDEAAANFGAQRSLGNALLRAGAGLSQTLSEQENQLVEQMRKGTASQDQFIAIWPGLVGKLNAQIGTTRAGYNPKVQETFDSRLNEAGSSVAFKPITSKHAPKSGKPENMSDADWAELQQLRGEVGGRK